MHSKKIALALFSVLVMLSLVAGQCAQPTPQTVVQTVVVTQEVVVTKEVQKEVQKEVVVTATPSPIPEAQLPDMSNVQFKNPDSIIYATIGEPESLDPAWTYETTGAEMEMNIYEGVVAFNREKATDFVPSLAEKWSVSDDGLTYTFNIRKGVTFHEGGTLEPHDVAYSWQRGMLQDRLDGPQWLMLGPTLGVGSIKELVDKTGNLKTDDPSTLDLSKVDAKVLADTCAVVQKAISADDAAGTVTLKLSTPAPWFLQLLASSFGAVYDKEWMAQNGDWDGDCATWQKWNDPAAEKSLLFSKANGTGPYKLDHWTKGEEVALVANDKYWRTEPMWPGGPSGAPQIKRITWKAVGEWGTRLAMLQAGDADSGDVPRGNISQIDPMIQTLYQGIDANAPTQQVNPKGSLILYKGYTTPREDIGAFTFNINVEGGNPFIGSGKLDGSGIPPDFFSDIHVRKAFNYCFDWDTFIKDAYAGEAIQARGPIIPGLLGYDDKSPVYSFDKDKCTAEFQASTLKSEDGKSLWDTGFYIQIPYNTGNLARQTMAEILKQNLEAVNPNFSVAVVNLPWPSFLNARTESRLTMTVAGWQEDYHDASNWVGPYMDCKTGAYARAQIMPDDLCTKWADLIAKGVSSLDPKVREPFYTQLQQEYYDNVPGIAMDISTGRHYEQKWLHGWYYNPLYPEPWSWVYALTKSQ
jgi:peptide/nickel transport system substrate-binding protein